jgi:predicted TPR repeat methyltransferase
LLAAALGPETRDLDILDLGCGTGLAGQAVRGLARRLTGVDLSAQMIAQLRRKQVYDELHVAEIGQFLAGHASSHDVILAADVLIYLGDLAPLLRQVAARLKPGGLFGFSIEAHEAGQAYVLRASGRYAHSPGQLRELARPAGLQGVIAEPQAVRALHALLVERYG